MQEGNYNPAPRLPLQLEIEFRRSYSRREEHGRLKNISLTGAFIEFESPAHVLGPQDKLVVKLLVSGRERSIPASVVWHNERGCGIRFRPTNNRDTQLVDDLMYFVENSRTGQRSVLDTIFKKVA
ncbi:MAG: PilZ domain-containing protein [Bdellovibrionota bacterium]